MLKRLLLSTAFSLVLQNGAIATELPDNTDGSAINVPFDWNGRYGGLQIGVWDQFSEFTIDGFGLVTSANASGVIAGGFVGTNWHASNVLLGIEADANFVTAEASGAGFIPVTFRTQAFTSLRARLGVTHDNLLLFGTVGGAYVRAGHDANAFGAVFELDDSGFTTTWGAGLEMAFKNRTTMRIEYRGFHEISNDYGQQILSQSVLGAHSVSSRMDVVTVGLSRFF